MSGEKTEKPTAKRRKEARKKGQIARTPDLGGWGILLAVGLVLPALVSHEMDVVKELMTTALSFPAVAAHAGLPGAGVVLRRAAEQAFLAVVVLGAGVMVVGVGASIAQGGFVVSPSLLKPSAAKLNPLKGAKRLFGPQTLWEGAKTLLKASVVGLVVYAAIKALIPLVGGLMPIPHVLDELTSAAVSMLRNVAFAGFVLAFADYAVARRRVGKQVRMTKEEVKQEYKQAEGDPQLKGAIRSRQLAMARNRMMADVPTADVVLVNPTHVAVALRYRSDEGAPKVVARGAGAVAAAIRAKATEAGVPLVRDVPLARALYTSTRVGMSIPPELFSAVATVLAFVITRKSRGMRGGSVSSPRRDEELPAVLPAGRRTGRGRKRSGPRLPGRSAA
ncbi:EscU/YscU/HrcU family type III secretion system export apparatus switch protein [Lapillicoccus jejuensis]|uniref:Flagellar biosynthetic protein FlhB n=1 Tax=Lapillicoccus jejuensis TaxID=402171 RepID=A0A542E4A4_9MICO|nr:EscU/YscU/HrcU family type III secretion system export apparatus switch protein [Lapillicoccus jejuensis]TQJ10147.1 flagellar biosynthetic protein FlhB [Lapillicoccus jejuensis]